MVLAHKAPVVTSSREPKASIRLEHVGDWTLAEACLDVASYRSDHGDLSKLDHWQVRSLTSN